MRDGFRDRRFTPVDPVDLLDYEGAELILIGARKDAEEDLGIEFRPENENEYRADVLKDLRLPREIVRESLFEGGWV
jgi:hypothetical protein